MTGLAVADPVIVVFKESKSKSNGKDKYRDSSPMAG
jgi:hypothetical protein